jgi:hypothetical protein
MPSLLLKRLAIPIAPIQCHLCDLSMLIGIFPLQLEKARILPLFKKSGLIINSASSYQHISNLTYNYKLAERVVAKRFKKHAANFQLFPPDQSAYRAYCSTDTALLYVHNDLVCSTGNGQVSLIVLLDLSAA